MSLGIIAILAGLLLPAIQAARESARSTSCGSKFRQWGIAVKNFESANKQLPGPSFNAPMNSSDYHWDRGLFVHLLDYVENSSSQGEGSNKSYLHSWAGLRIGNIVDFGGRSINVDNSRSAPFSRHGMGCHFVLSDGSTRFVSESTTPSILFACASLAGGENAPLDL